MVLLALALALVLAGVAAMAAGTSASSDPGSRGPGDTRTGEAFVSEEFDDPIAGLLAGRFNAAWQPVLRSDWIDGPSRVPVDDAIAWARAHARVVTVRTGLDDAEYSAGDLPSPGIDNRWPEGATVLPRAEGEPITSSRDTVWWLVAVRIPRGVKGSSALAALAREALTSTPQIKAVTAIDASASEYVVRCQVLTRGTARALDMVAGALPPEIEARIADAGYFPYPVVDMEGRAPGHQP